ncbi:PAS domain-containing protein [Rhizobium sp. CG5]|uniref:PAS domain-containing protein n=1 Tax=Rhizobium sp. CG5 TaxID=2726076 RepID=UPI002034795D|nr:PAS domain-containing protein [Rhizobium sp. CG5]MCM2474892.1 PAS domain-containing protein [Rhizobium sp. CG5]
MAIMTCRFDVIQCVSALKCMSIFRKVVASAMSQGGRDGHLSVLFDALLLRTRQLQQAVRVGNDDLVLLLDRQLDPLISAIVEYRAETTQQVHQQLGFFSELVRQDADDRSCVVRYSGALAVLLDRYFGDGNQLDNWAPPQMPVRAGSAGQSSENDIVLNEAILDALPDRIFVLTRDYRYLYANAAYAASVQSVPLDLIGRHVSDVMGEACFEREAKRNFDGSFDGQAVECRGKRRLPSGDVAVYRRFIPMQAGNGPVIGAILQERDLPEPAGEGDV